ncbi:MAG TPA: SRPBCC family protein [Candidatus Binatia bacterium]|nr:SRPBCC family protein [Candidatus Binatia bacterium]
MRKESLAFLARAPAVHVTEGRVAAPRPAVFAAFADAGGWKAWFPRLRDARYTSRPPYGVGTTRVADVGGTRWQEEMIAWDPDARLAWTVTGASVPFATALVESWDLADAGEGTRVRWTFALEPRLLARLGAPFAPRALARVLAGATVRLEARLARPAA